MGGTGRGIVSVCDEGVIREIDEGECLMMLLIP